MASRTLRPPPADRATGCVWVVFVIGEAFA